MNVSVSIFIHRHIIYYFISIYIKLKCPILFLRMSLHFLFYSTLDIQTVFLRPSFTNWKQTTFPMSRHICSVSPNFSFFFLFLQCKIFNNFLHYLYIHSHIFTCIYFKSFTTSLTFLHPAVKSSHILLSKSFHQNKERQV